MLLDLPTCSFHFSAAPAAVFLAIVMPPCTLVFTEILAYSDIIIETQNSKKYLCKHIEFAYFDKYMCLF